LDNFGENHGFYVDSDDDNVDPFGVSAQSFMSRNSRMTNKSGKSGKNQIKDKKAVAQFWNWGKEGFNKEEKALKEDVKARFMSRYRRVIELA
jgi:hypothetical protein